MDEDVLKPEDLTLDQLQEKIDSLYESYPNTTDRAIRKQIRNEFKALVLIYNTRVNYKAYIENL